jgi:cytochrome c553
MTKTTFTMLAAAALAAGSVHAQAPAGPSGDAARGAAKVQMCQGCHGIEGWRTAFPEVYTVPRIAGQHPQYFVNALKAYRSGERQHPSMRGIAASLSDQDMADLAAYYAQPATETVGKASK